MIAREGTSADRQEDTYREAMLDGASEQEALRTVVERIRRETEGETTHEKNASGNVRVPAGSGTARHR